MAKTRDAMKIIGKMVGDDAELKQLIADARVSSQVAEMVNDARMTAGLTQNELVVPNDAALTRAARQ